MNHEAELRAAISATLATEVKAHSLVQACVRFGLEGGQESEAWASKATYVGKRLEDKQLADLLKIGDAVLHAYEGYKLHAFRLKEALRFARAGGKRRISEITRTNLLDELLLMGRLEGKLELGVFLAKLWPVDQMASHDHRHKTFGGEVWQHMIMNDDWTPQYLLERLGVAELSDEALSDLLELVVHPSVRQDDEQRAWAAAISKHLIKDGYTLYESERISGFPVLRVRPTGAGVAEAPKNLIFASNGPKPEVVLSDAIHNDLRIVKNGEFCLFYDRPIPQEGLRWSDLVAWWAEVHKLDQTDAGASRHLYRRLAESLKDSPPEQLLFRSYYASFKDLGDRLPALLPQVYVHFDPATVKELYGEKRLARQRMDFLLLLDHGHRVVLEVDGAQHYSEDGRPSPARYAQMVEADRQLRLCGYEVFRFGGAELQGDGAAEAVAAFFKRLFEKHRIP